MTGTLKVRESEWFTGLIAHTMASKKQGKSPFSMFSGLDDIDSSDLSSEEEEEKQEDKKESDSTKLSFISKSETDKDDGNALPPPKDLFEKVDKPDFLKNRSKTDINWDNLVMNDTVLEVDDDLDRSNTNCMPPPESYDSQTEAIPPAIGDPSESGATKRPASSGGCTCITSGLQYIIKH